MGTGFGLLFRGLGECLFLESCATSPFPDARKSHLSGRPSERRSHIISHLPIGPFTRAARSHNGPGLCRGKRRSPRFPFTLRKRRREDESRIKTLPRCFL